MYSQFDSGCQWDSENQTPLRAYYTTTPSPVSGISVSGILRTNTSSLNTRKKHVRIISPVAWHKFGILKKTAFINRTLTFCDLKDVIRSMGMNATGNYNGCVDKLIHSNWVPNHKLILFNDKLRAKLMPTPVDNTIISLQSNDTNYLSSLNMNDLKKWLKFNHIKQPSCSVKCEYVKLIQKNYWIHRFRSPSRDCLIERVPAKRPKSVKHLHSTGISLRSMPNINYTKNIQDEDGDIVMPKKLAF